MCGALSTTSRSWLARNLATGSRIIHRTLRDHYRDIANEITRSLNESLQSTVAAAHVEEAERDNKVRELERQLNILNQVTDNVDKLTPQVTVGRV